MRVRRRVCPNAIAVMLNRMDTTYLRPAEIDVETPEVLATKSCSYRGSIPRMASTYRIESVHRTMTFTDQIPPSVLAFGNAATIRCTLNVSSRAREIVAVNSGKTGGRAEKPAAQGGVGLFQSTFSPLARR